MSKTAIIVLNYNDSETVINYIDLIKNYSSIDRIVIVDNSSTDNSYEILKKLENKKINVIKTEENRGYAYGNNYGVHFLEEKNEYYDNIIISNADIYVTNETIEKCTSFLDKHNDVAIVSPTMYMKDGSKSPLAGWKERKLNSDVRDSSIRLTKKYNNPHVECYDKKYFKGDYSFVDCVPGSFFIIKYKIFKEVNYFDENTFLYFEEDILGKKIKNLGYKVALMNKERFSHFESVTINKNVMPLKKYKILQKSKRYYHSRYNEECKGLGKLNLIKLDLATFMGKNEIRVANSKICNKLKNVFKNIGYNGISLIFVKLILYFLNIVFLPFKLIIRKIRKRKKVCYFSLVTWKWIKQRPHFVALKLSEKYNVTYTYLEVYKKYVNEVNKDFDIANNDIDNKHLKVKPFKIYPGIKKYRLLKNLKLLKLAFINYDKYIFTSPNQIEYVLLKILKMNRINIYYECMDNYIEWENSKAAFEINESNLIRYSKRIVVSSNKLKEMLMNKYGVEDSKLILVRNGYDSKLFDNYKKSDIKLNNKSIVYIGTIDKWFNIDLIEKYARKHKDVTFYLVGPINPSMKKIEKLNIKNIIIYGIVEHSMVPDFIEKSDVMIMPFIVNNIIEYVDPVKVYEYLYFKKPVVSSYWEELTQFNDLIYYYKNEEEFDRVLTSALNSKFKISKKYSNIMEESKWDNRLSSYINGLEE